MGDQRHPISIQIIGVIQKDRKKLFMTSVLWSDQCDIIVYRSFQEFKNLHNQLKRVFAETPFRRSRIIPKFKARSLTNFQDRGPKSVHRLKLLEKYCKHLLGCDPSVAQSSTVVHFFLPKNQDLEPEFTKDSIIIMPPEDMVDTPKRSDVSNITHPFVTETYWCVAPYETKDIKNRPFKVAVDDVVDVLIKDKGGWWLVENEDKCLAWFPAPYLEKRIEEEEEENDGQEGLQKEEGVLYRTVKTYTSKQEDEVSVHIGAVVEVLQKSNNGWWLVRYGGKAGYLPSMYLQPYTKPHLRFLNLQRETHIAAQLSASSNNLLAAPHRKLSRSQQNLQLASCELRSGDLEPINGRKSRSMSNLFQSRLCGDPPAIMVTGPEDKGGSSGGSQSSSLNSPLSSSFGSQSLSLSCSDMQESLRLCRTPPPTISTTPLWCLDEALPRTSMAHSRSDPKLFKMSTSPKVPPRPCAQEILSRCTSVTRNAALGPKCNSPTEVMRIQSC